MGVFFSLDDIKNIYCGEEEIKTIYAGDKVVYQSGEIDPTYNYFVYDLLLSEDDTCTVKLNEYRLGDNTAWSGYTDWGDGTVNKELTHTYEKCDKYTVKTKWANLSKELLISCKNINKNITNARSLFDGCKNLIYADLSRLNTRNINDMSFMFNKCESLEGVNMEGWDTSNVIDMSYMFFGCTKLTPKVSHFNTSSVVDMQHMFRYCESLFDGSQFSNWDTSNVKNMDCMFYYTTIKSELDLSSWDVSNVESFAYMFAYCSSHNGINISNWDIEIKAYITNVSCMFMDNKCSYSCNDVEHHVKHDGIPGDVWQKMTKHNKK